jgi:hypothetical protein
MAVPTITSITPNTGLTGGRLLVEVIGTNFQLPPVPPLTGPSDPVNPSVSVLFGTQESPVVAVISPTRLHVLTPSATFDPTAANPGAVSVTVRNITQAGAVIAGETATLVNGFTYTRPALETTSQTESLLARVVRAIIVELRRQILNNVELTVHTDYADMPGTGMAMLSSLPGLVLAGPRIRRNAMFTDNSARAEAAGGGLYTEARPSYTVDLVFSLTGVDDTTQRLLNLMHEATTFFLRNRYLKIPRDPAAPNGSLVQYEMGIEPAGDFDMGTIAGSTENSNIRTFSGEFAILGLDLDDPSMTRAVTATVEDILLGGVISDGSGSPTQADGSPQPSAGVGYNATGITVEQKLP